MRHGLSPGLGEAARDSVLALLRGLGIELPLAVPHLPLQSAAAAAAQSPRTGAAVHLLGRLLLPRRRLGLGRGGQPLQRVPPLAAPHPLVLGLAAHRPSATTTLLAGIGYTTHGIGHEVLRDVLEMQLLPDGVQHGLVMPQDLPIQRSSIEKYHEMK